MKGDKRPMGDRDTQRGIANSIAQALGLPGAPLLVDAAADAAFASSIARLRGVPGSHKGGSNEQAR